MEKLAVQMGKLYKITEKVDLKMDIISLRMINLDLKVNYIERNQRQSEEIFSANMENSKQESKDESSEELKRMHDTLLDLNETASEVAKSLAYFQTSVSEMLSPLKSLQQSQTAIENIFDTMAKDDELTEKCNMTVVNEAARIYVASSQGKHFIIKK